MKTCSYLFDCIDVFFELHKLQTNRLLPNDLYTLLWAFISFILMFPSECFFVIFYVKFANIVEFIIFRLH